MASDMPDTLTLQLIQLETTGDVQENIRRMQNAVNEKAQFVLLPELWNCPYDNAEIRKAAVFGEACRQAMAEAARKKTVWMAGSIPLQDPADGRIYNMALVFDADGAEVCRYAKTHLMEVHTPHSHYSEAEVFTPGDRFETFETPWGKMGILVCYDIRFPEPARILGDAGIRLLLLPAAFNEAVGRKHWQSLLCARAIENQIFVAGCNPDYAWGKYKAWGHSLAVSPDGMILQEGSGMVTLDLSETDRIRQRMPYRKIRRRDLYDRTGCTVSSTETVRPDRHTG